MICPNCQHENIPTAKFCLECGTRLRTVCTQCGTELPPTARFCHECGASLTAPAAAPAKVPTLQEQFTSFQEALPASLREHLLTPEEGENRIVTVLFADMSSSVQATAQLHPEEAAALVNRLLKAMVDALLKYEGRVDRFLGDGVLAAFGVPHAHESDPDRAIQAALAIREAAQQLGLQVTAGINTGEVYVGGMGSERHQEVTVMGPVVNLAARLQGQAEPGQILVGEATYRHTRRAFEFSPRSLEIKGLAQPVAAYVVERALPRPEKVRGIEGLRAELIGRDAEFARLKEALDALLQGRGQMVSLIGEAGVGKSRLVAELKQAVGVWPSPPSRSRSRKLTDENENEPNTERPTPLWLEGRCLELGMTASYWPFVDIFRDHFAWGPEESEPARAGRLVAALQELVTRGDLSKARFDEMGPLLGNLLSVRFGNEWDERLQNASPEEIKHRTFLAVRDFFLALSRRQPLILVFEDLHWADSLSLDLISLLMETITFAPLMLLCVYRPERESTHAARGSRCWHLGTIAARKCAERYTEISLRELSRSQGRRLIDSLLAIDNLPLSVKEAILEKSSGNPFFVEEVVRSLIDAGMIYRDGEVWRAREGIESITVPESIQSVILSRVDRLEQELKHVLQSASVIGRLFRRRLLGHVTRKEIELDRALWELEELQLIYQEQVIPEEEYSFKHVLTQETVYQNILRRRRAPFHQQVAEAMERLYQDSLDEYYEQIAYHYERSGVDEKAVEYLLKAGEKARRAHLNEDAIGCFHRALARLDGSPAGDALREWRLQALRGLGQIYQGIGKQSEAEEYFRQAITLAQEMRLAPQELARLYFWLGEVLFWQGRYDERIRLGEEGLALVGDDTQSVGAALMNSLIGWGHMAKGNLEKAREFTLRNVQFIQCLPYSEELRPVYTHIVGLYSFINEDREEAVRWFRIYEQMAEQHHDVRGLGEVHHERGSLFLRQGDCIAGISEVQRGLEEFRRIGNRLWECRCLHRLGWAYRELGDLQKAESSFRQGIATAEGMDDWPNPLPWLYADFGMISLCHGRWDEATAAFRKAAQLAQEAGRSGAWSTQSLGRVFLAQGKRQEALAQFQAAIALPEADAFILIEALSGLEEAYDDPAEFRAFCRRYREEHPELATSFFVQWFLEPTQPDIGFSIIDFGLPTDTDQIEDPKAEIQSGTWVWQDPFGDCSFSLQNGLEIHAANGRDLWRLNLSAPRLLRSIDGPSFAIQTACIPVSEAKPAIGGVLLWKDQDNFLRLERGAKGNHEIVFEGCLNSEHYQIGRGRLLSDHVFLRLERIGDRVNALCSADGESWFTVGHVAFPVEGALEVGMYALGAINRNIYPGAYPDGAAIRFESFQVWRQITQQS